MNLPFKPFAALASRFLDVESMPWEKTAYPGVEQKTLLVDKPSGLVTALMRMAPGARLPDHQHVRIEQTFVLEGELSALLGGELVRAGPGALVLKPRQQPHTFWNQGPGITRILEIISPSGFEHYFEAMGEVLAASRTQADLDSLVALAEQRYGLTFDFSSLEVLKQKYGVALA